MVRRLKWIGCFTSVLFVVLSCLVVSPKTRAYELVTNIMPTGKTAVIGTDGLSCLMENLKTGELRFATKGSLGECSFRDLDQYSDTWVVRSLYFNKPIDVKKDHFYKVLLIFQTEELIDVVNWTLSVPNGGVWSIAEFKKQNDRAVDGFCDVYEQLPTNTNRWYCSNNNILSYNSKIYEVTLKANVDAQGVYWYFGNPDGVPKSLFIPFFGALTMTDITEYSMSDPTSMILEQDKAESQQQGTQSNTDSDQAGQSVEGATTNLLSAVTGFFGAFTSASATTCQTDWGIEGFRNFDFCGTQVPSELRIVFTIVASIIFIPMIWFLITSILNAFKEFQQ